MVVTTLPSCSYIPPVGTITIVDGLQKPLSTWKPHIVNVMKRCGYFPIESQVKFTQLVDDEDGSETLMEKATSGECWAVDGDVLIQQDDGYNCGPIACAKILEIFGLLPCPVTDIKIVL